VSVVEGQVFLQIALVFGLIGLLGLVLRWTFRRDPVERPDRATPVAAETDSALPLSPSNPPAAPSAKQAGDTSKAPKRPGDREDYGLLAVAAEVSTADEAAKVRRVLSAAGIRSTNADTGDGRHRVLVFGDELIKARRVAGGSQGAGGGTAGTSGS
jgi:hypothetical protein